MGPMRSLRCPWIGGLQGLTLYYPHIHESAIGADRYLFSHFFTHIRMIMFTDPSFSNMLAIVLFLALSYGLIWLQRHRPSIMNRSQRTPYPSPQPSLIKSEVDPVLLDTADSLIHGLIMDKGRCCSDQEILDAIGKRLSNYTWLENPAFIRALNFYMQTEGQRLAGKVFSPHRLEATWEKFRLMMEKERWDAEYVFIVHPKNPYI